MNESEYQSRVIATIYNMLPGCIVIKNDSSYMPGIPDLLVLYGDKWAMLEVKVLPTSKRQPNQDYYVELLDSMSFAAYIHPGIEEEILHDLQCAFRVSRKARIPQPK